MLYSPAHKRKRRLQLRLSERRFVLMAGDALVVVFSVLIALSVWAYRAQYAFDLEFLTPQIAWFFVLTGLWFLLASANDYYELAIAADRWASVQRLTLITLQLFVVYVIVFFLSERDSLPRLFILYYAVSSFILLILARLLNPALIGWASAPRRALVVGTGWAATVIIDAIKHHAAQSYEVLGIIAEADAETPESSIDGIPIVGAGEEMLSKVISLQISEIIVAYDGELPTDIFQGVMDAYEYNIAITPMPLLYERITERVPVEHVGANWTVVLPLDGTSVFNPYPVLKRMMDLTMAIIGLIIFLPLLPFIALAIYLDSPGSIFFIQERTGLNGQPFNIIKLRTMVPDAEKQTGAVYAQEDDPRVTRVGRFMRKTRLDELPQLFNVLKGEMSMIGPRPERPEHIERLQAKIPFYRTRHTMKPGVTGWAQVRYGYGADDDDALVKLQYDLYYARHQSVLLDMQILMRTVGKVLRMSGQ